MREAIHFGLGIADFGLACSARGMDQRLLMGANRC